MMIKCIALFALVAVSTAYVIPEDEYRQYLVVGHYEPEEYEPVDIEEHARFRRSFAPGAPQFPGMPQQKYPSNVGAQIDKVGPDTIATIKAGHETKQTQVSGTWSKVVRGPNKAKPNFSVGVSHRW